jgi:hypothetical protein
LQHPLNNGGMNAKESSVVDMINITFTTFDICKCNAIAEIVYEKTSIMNDMSQRDCDSIRFP